MTTLALSQPADLQWNWPRVGALSGALSLHFIAFVLLLAPPTAMTLLRPLLQDITDVRIIEPPPRQFEEPAPPTPKKIVHEVRQLPPTPKPVQAPVAAPIAESPMQSQVADPGPPGPAITSTAPADVAPVALAYNTRTRIPYPLDAAKLHQQGTVILNVLVGGDGLPQTVEIEKSSGFRALDIAARDAVRRWTFRAGTRNGITTALWARVPITFSLQTL